MDCWYGCYDYSLKGVISEESFSHPAKFSWGLIRRISQHILDEGWVKKGDVVLDPFAGVGVGGVACAYAGLKWVGIELEANFISLAEESFALHDKTWQHLRLPRPIIFQGDSRKMVEILSEQIAAIITSPPFGKQQTGSGLAKPDAVYAPDGSKFGVNHGYQRQGATPGQLGSMRPGKFEEVIQAIVTSPPFGEAQTGGVKIWGQVEEKYNRGYSERSRTGGYLRDLHGTTPGQVGQQKGDSYWESMLTIYRACHAILPSGGQSAPDGEGVDFCACEGQL